MVQQLQPLSMFLKRFSQAVKDTRDQLKIYLFYFIEHVIKGIVLKRHVIAMNIFTKSNRPLKRPKSLFTHTSFGGCGFFNVPIHIKKFKKSLHNYVKTYLKLFFEIVTLLFVKPLLS